MPSSTHKPVLIVIAGCNGSGKSSFSKAFTPKFVIPFDYDKQFLTIYNSLIQSEFQDVMAHNMTRELLEKSVNESIAKKADFCYETNFNSTPLFWPRHFKKAGYQLNLIFFCLDSIKEAKRRVLISVENGGHYVPENEITTRFYEGYKNLDKYFHEFDNVHLFNTSQNKQEPKHIVSISSRKPIEQSEFPKFLKNLLPDIYKIINV